MGVGAARGTRGHFFRPHCSRLVKHDTIMLLRRSVLRALRVPRWHAMRAYSTDPRLQEGQLKKILTDTIKVCAPRPLIVPGPRSPHGSRVHAGLLDEPGLWLLCEQEQLRVDGYTGYSR